jgi:excisionase family DNA binding protein
MPPELENITGTPLLLDVRGAAKRLSVSVVTIRKLVRSQRLARVPDIRKLLIPETSLRQFAETAE